MIAVTFALPQESKDLRAKLKNARHEKREPQLVENDSSDSSASRLDAALPILTGEINGEQIAICHTGIGGESATRQLRELTRRHRPQSLISAGFAGGLDPRLVVGNLLVATNFSDEKLLDAARHVCEDFACCYFGTLTTQPQVAETSESKIFLHQTTRASAVDMETEVIAEACRKLCIPMIALRAISDIASEQLPVPFAVWFDAQKQTPRPAALLRYLAQNPSRIRPFARFVSDINHARRKLTDYLENIIGEMSKPSRKPAVSPSRRL